MNTNQLLNKIKGIGLVDIKLCNNNNLWRKSIYIAKRSHNWYKIGISKNIPQRISNLQVGSPEKLHVIHEIPLEGNVYFIERNVIANIGANLPINCKSGEWVRLQGTDREIKAMFSYMVHGVVNKVRSDIRSEEHRWNLAMKERFGVWEYMKSPIRTFIRKGV